MASTLSPTQFEFASEPLDRPSLRRRPALSEYAADPPVVDRPSLPRRAARVLVRYLIAVGVGVGGTLAWQTHGAAARQMIASWAAEHGWRISGAEPSAGATGPAPGAEIAAGSSTSSEAQTSAPGAPQAASAAAPDPAASGSADAQQLKAVALTLAALRQRVEQLAAGQEQFAAGHEQLEREIARLQAAEQEIRQKLPAAPSRPAAAPPGKPVSLAPPASRAPAAPR